MRWSATLLFRAFFGDLSSCKQDFTDRADDSDSCVSEQKEYPPDFFLIDHPTGNDENGFSEFTDAEFWSDDRFPENEVRRKASRQVMLQTMRWSATLLFRAFFGDLSSCKQDFADRADDSDSCVSEQEEEDPPDFFLIDHPTGNYEILVIEFESDKDAELWSDDRFPENEVRLKASRQVILKTMICTVLLVCIVLFGVSDTYKRGFHHGGEDAASLACVGLNFSEQEEDAIVYLPIAPDKPVDNEIRFIELSDDSFPTVVLNQHVTVLHLNGSNATDLVGPEVFMCGFQEAEVVFVAKPPFALLFKDLLLLPDRPSNVQLGYSLIQLDSRSKFCPPFPQGPLLLSDKPWKDQVQSSLEIVTHLPYKFSLPRTPLLTPLPMIGALIECDGHSNQFMMHRIIIGILLAILVAVLKPASRHRKDMNKQVVGFEVEPLATSDDDGNFPFAGDDGYDDGGSGTHLDSLQIQGTSQIEPPVAINDTRNPSVANVVDSAAVALQSQVNSTDEHRISTNGVLGIVENSSNASVPNVLRRSARIARRTQVLRRSARLASKPRVSYVGMC